MQTTTRSVGEVTSIIFSDVNFFLSPADNYTLVYDEDSIKNSVLTILRTAKGSRPFQRNFGTSLLNLVFEPLNNLTAARIRTELFEAITSEEPRLSITNLIVRVDENLDSYYVNLEGSIPRLNGRAFSLAFNLKKPSVGL